MTVEDARLFRWADCVVFDPVEFGQRVRTQREKVGKTQAECAREMVPDISARHWSYWETGQLTPAVTHVCTIAQVLELPVGMIGWLLLGWSEDE